MIRRAKTEDEFADLAVKNKWDKLILHHTENPPGKAIAGEISREEQSKIVEMIDKSHKNYRGWKNGLGYHVMVFPDGNEWYADRWAKQLSGAHTKGENSDSVGVALYGNYDIDDITDEQILSVSLIWVALEKHLNRALDLKCHRDFSKKSCPGKNINKDVLAEIRQCHDFLVENEEVYVAMQMMSEVEDETSMGWKRDHDC